MIQLRVQSPKSVSLSALVLIWVVLVPAFFDVSQASEVSPEAEAGSSYTVHTVQPGETLYSISVRYSSTVSQLAELNGLEDPDVLIAGQTLLIPAQPDSERLKLRNLLEERKRKLGGYSDRMLIAMVIEAEAGSEPLEGKIAVGAVIVNRVSDPEFPGTVLDVVVQPGQFLSVENGQIPCTPSSSSLKAADRALSGEDPTGGALYFYNPEKTTTPDWWSTRPVIKTIGNHAFAI